MIRHIVLWRLLSPSGDKQQVLDKIRAALEAQRGKIPGLLRVEVGENLSASRRAVDFALVMDFESRDALASYHKHPAHLETRQVVDPLIDEHWIADYEI